MFFFLFQTALSAIVNNGNSFGFKLNIFRGIMCVLSVITFIMMIVFTKLSMEGVKGIYSFIIMLCVLSNAMKNSVPLSMAKLEQYILYSVPYHELCHDLGLRLVPNFSHSLCHAKSMTFSL